MFNVIVVIKCMLVLITVENGNDRVWKYFELIIQYRFQIGRNYLISDPITPIKLSSYTLRFESKIIEISSRIKVDYQQQSAPENKRKPFRYPSWPFRYNVCKITNPSKSSFLEP